MLFVIHSYLVPYFDPFNVPKAPLSVPDVCKPKFFFLFISIIFCLFIYYLSFHLLSQYSVSRYPLISIFRSVYFYSFVSIIFRHFIHLLALFFAFLRIIYFSVSKSNILFLVIHSYSIPHFVSSTFTRLLALFFAFFTLYICFRLLIQHFASRYPLIVPSLFRSV